MTKGKSPPKKKEYFVKTHSKRTGALILIALGIILAGGLGFFYLAFQESERLNQIEIDWRLQDCDTMKEDFHNNPEQWKFNAITDKCLTP